MISPIICPSDTRNTNESKVFKWAEIKCIDRSRFPSSFGHHRSDICKLDLLQSTIQEANYAINGLYIDPRAQTYSPLWWYRTTYDCNIRIHSTRGRKWCAKWIERNENFAAVRSAQHSRIYESIITYVYATQSEQSSDTIIDWKQLHFS